MPEILAAKGRTICRKVWSEILQKWPLPSHLHECLLPQIYDKWLTVTLRLSVRNMFSKPDLRQHMIKEYWSSNFRLCVLPLFSKCELRQQTKFVNWRSDYSISLQKNDRCDLTQLCKVLSDARHVSKHKSARRATKEYWISDKNVSFTNWSNSELKMVSKVFAPKF